LSGYFEKVRGNTDVPKAWTGSSEIKRKLEATQHVSLQESVQQSANVSWNVNINIKLYEKTDEMDSHLAPFHTVSYSFTVETYFSPIICLTSVHLM